MINDVFPIVVLSTALGSALMAGMFFTFSNFVMRALGRIKPQEGIAAMQQINIVILNPLFFLAFMGTAIASIALPLSLFWFQPEVNVNYLILGSASYLLGVMLVTIVFNVPMNDALEATDAKSEEAAKLWQKYLVTWTNWNHVRSIASFLGTLFFILALV